MAKFGYDETRLTAEKDLIDKVIKANRDQDKEVGSAQQATKNRDEKMDALEEWLSDFIAIARVAFSEAPQLLEKMLIEYFETEVQPVVKRETERLSKKLAAGVSTRLNEAASAFGKDSLVRDV